MSSWQAQGILRDLWRRCSLWFKLSQSRGKKRLTAQLVKAVLFVVLTVQIKGSEKIFAQPVGVLLFVGQTVQIKGSEKNFAQPVGVACFVLGVS
jgi:hypothetical protein